MVFDSLVREVGVIKTSLSKKYQTESTTYKSEQFQIRWYLEYSKIIKKKLKFKS